MKKLAVLLTLSLILGTGGCSNEQVEIGDAFCIYSESSYFPFQFTLKNLLDRDVEISYTWTLNDPMADFPGSQEGVNDPAARIYQGQGTASLSASESKEITVNISQVREYDPRFYVMYIYVYHDGVQVGYYRGQKSPFDWDYDTTPPVPKGGK